MNPPSCIILNQAQYIKSLTPNIFPQPALPSLFSISVKSNFILLVAQARNGISLLLLYCISDPSQVLLLFLPLKYIQNPTASPHLLWYHSDPNLCYPCLNYCSSLQTALPASVLVPLRLFSAWQPEGSCQDVNLTKSLFCSKLAFHVTHNESQSPHNNPQGPDLPYHPYLPICFLVLLLTHSFHPHQDGPTLAPLYLLFLEFSSSICSHSMLPHFLCIFNQLLLSQ